jgi:hypothetical protein
VCFDRGYLSLRCTEDIAAGHIDNKGWRELVGPV